jgi:hypothetical protein
METTLGSRKAGRLDWLTTWLAFVAALCLALPQPLEISLILLGALIGAVLIGLGYAAASRSRDPIPLRTPSQRARLALLSLLSGALLGAGLLGILALWASVEPALRARFAGRLGEPAWRPWALAFESSILEEVVFRLFALTVIAWLTRRLLRRSEGGTPFTFALAASALLFGLAHLPAWLALAPASVPLVCAVLTLNGLGGLLFGWLYWRWGLAYAICCHFAGDVVIQALGPRILSL